MSDERVSGQQDEPGAGNWSQPSAPSSPPPPPEQPSSAWVPPAGGPAGAPAKRGGKGAIVIVGAILVFLAVVLFAVRNNVSADDLAVGDCFMVPDGSEILTVEKHACTEPHDAEVFFVGEYAGDSYPISLSLDSYLEDNCFPAYETYLGRALDADPELAIGYFYPTREAWDSGDKTITCYVTQPDASPLTESVRAT